MSHATSISFTAENFAFLRSKKNMSRFMNALLDAYRTHQLKQELRAGFQDNAEDNESITLAEAGLEEYLTIIDGKDV